MNELEKNLKEQQEKVERLPPHKQVYRDHQKNFDEVLQNALLNVIAVGSDEHAINKINGNKLSFIIDKHYTLLAIAGVLEKQIGSHRFYQWTIRCAILVNKTQRIHRQSSWTRKQRRIIINVGKGIMEGCGERGSESYDIVNGYFIGGKAVDADEKKVIQMVREEVAVEIDDPPKKKRGRPKKETAQNEPSTRKTTKRSRRVLPQVQEELL